MADETFEEKPTEVQIPEVEGAFYFICCGQQQLAKGKIREVTCKKCWTTYSIQLVPRWVVDQKYPKGMKMRLLRDIDSQVGSAPAKFTKDEMVVVGQDLYGVLGTLDGMTLVEVYYPTPEGFPRTMLAPVPNDALTPIEEPGEIPVL